MSQRFWLWSFGFALLLCGTMVFSPSANAGEQAKVTPEKSVTPPKKKLPSYVKRREYKIKNGVYQEILPNGLTLILKEMRTAPVVTIQGWVKFGSIHEQEYLGAGVAHYIEHMIFKGTPTRGPGVFDREIRGAGGSLNAYTSHERTVLHCTIASKHFNTGLDAVADVLQHCLFDPKEVIKEQDVITREQERYLDSPGRIMNYLFNGAMWQQYPRRYPVGGYIDRFLKLKRDDLVTLYKRFYIPNNSAIIIVGDFSIKEKLPAIRAAFSSWARGIAPTPKVPRDLWPVGTREVSDYHKNTRTTRVKIGWPTVNLRDPAMYPLDVLASIMGQGRTSRLYRRLVVKEKLVRSVSAGNWTPNDHWGFFSIDGSLFKRDDKDRFMAIVDEEIARVATQGVSAEEVKRAIKKVAAGNVFGRATVEGVAGSLGSGWQIGDVHFDEYYLKQLSRVTRADIQAAAKKWLGEEPRTIATLYPGKPPSDAAMPDSESDQAKRNFAITQSTFPNGVRLLIKKNKGVPEAQIRVVFLGGNRYEPKGQEGINGFMASLLDKGTVKRPAEEIFQTIEDIGGSLGAGGGRQSITLQARVLREDLATALDLLSDIAQHPRFDPKWIERLRPMRLRAIAEREQNAQGKNFDTIFRLVYGDHPFGRRGLGTVKTVKSFTRESFIAYHKLVMQPKNCVISVVGDVDPSAVIKTIGATFGKWQGTFTAPTVPPLKQPTTPTEKRVAQDGINLSHLALAFPTVKQGHPDEYVLDVIQRILGGMGSRLFRDMRDQQSLAYMVGCFQHTGLDGGAFIFYIAPSPHKKGNLTTFAAVIKQSRLSFLKHARDLRETPVSQKDLDFAKRNLIGTRAIGLQSNGQQAMRIALDVIYGFPPEHSFTYADKINAVTIADIQRVAKKYFVEDRVSTAVTKPQGVE